MAEAQSRGHGGQGLGCGRLATCREAGRGLKPVFPLPPPTHMPGSQQQNQRSQRHEPAEPQLGIGKRLVSTYDLGFRGEGAPEPGRPAPKAAVSQRGCLAGCISSGLPLPTCFCRGHNKIGRLLDGEVKDLPAQRGK